MVQPEDEIAGINMAIGASFAGARSMVATSGGGFSLMVEGLGLAGATENPLVVVEGQRPGPSTGLATRTAQGDLRFCLHASQGISLESCSRRVTQKSASSKRLGRSISLMHSKRRCSFSLTSIWRPRFLRLNPSKRTGLLSIAAYCSQKERYLLILGDMKRPHRRISTDRPGNRRRYVQLKQRRARRAWLLL